MRILLAGSSPTAECLSREIEANLYGQNAVVANLWPLDNHDRAIVRQRYAEAARVSFQDFDPGSNVRLEEVLLEGDLGFDAIVYPPHTRGISEELFRKVLTQPGLARHLRVIGCPNASLEALDLIAASAQEFGVTLLNSLDVHAGAVAEYTLCQIGFHARHCLFFYEATGQSGAWPHQEAITRARSLAGRVLGILGASGKDGYAVASLAVEMGLNVVCTKPRSAEGEQRLKRLGATIVDTVEELLKVADFLSINCKNNESTHGLISAEHIALMKQGMIIVNPSGAEILDKAAILAEFAKASHGRRIGTLILDMPYGGRRDSGAFTADPDNALLKTQGVLFTPRLAGYTLDARMRAVESIAMQVRRHLEVTGPSLSESAGRLSHFLDDEAAELLLERIIALVQLVDRRALEMRQSGLSVSYKQDGSPVTDADVIVEKMIKEGIQKYGYSFRFGGEETTYDEPRVADFEVIVDGIDGTRNFRDGNYGWCTSVAVIAGGRTHIGVINDGHSGDTYFARLGTGAFVRSKTFTKRIRIPDALPADFSFSIGSFRIAGSTEIKRHIIDDFKKLGGREREWGCVGLSVCAVARGGLGAFIQGNSPRHDHVAAVLFAEEAGAKVNVIQKPSTDSADLIICHPAIADRVHAMVGARTAGLRNS